jgi:hypothetical protein
MSDEQHATAGPLPGIRDVFATVLETVTGGIAAAVKGSARDRDMEEVVTSAVRGAVGMGSDLVMASKAIAMGVLQGSGEKGEAALKILSAVAKIVIHHTADRGGDLAAATKGLILGAIASARGIGVETAKASTTAAQGILEGASAAGSVTVERVLAALKEPIGGSKVALPERSRS